MHIAEVILSEYYQFIPHSLSYVFSSETFPLQKGDTVLVPFGKSKMIAALVIDITSIKNKKKNITYKSILKKLPFSLSSQYIDLASYISQYYFCPLQKCLRLFLPKDIWTGKYKEKEEFFFKISEDKTKEDFLHLKGSKQKDIIKTLKAHKELSQKQLQQETQASISSIHTLVTKSFLQQYTQKEKKLPLVINHSAFHVLSQAQANALDHIKNNQKNVLYGVTGSGKTEVFLHFFRWIYENDPQAQNLFLVPEIALTIPMIEYFERAFPKQVVVIHSQISAQEKCKIWKKIAQGNIRLIIGSRSAFFLPFKNLHAIIIDESHEWTYCSEKTPQYNIKEVAEMFIDKTYQNNKNDISFNSVSQKKIFLTLASATPDICDMYKAQTNTQWNLVHLEKRVHNIPMPKVHIVNMCEEFQRKNFSPISEMLDFEIQKSLKKGKQVILFLNRRGFSSGVQCQECGYILECQDCDIPLTYHKNKDNNIEKLLCHYCFLLKDMIYQCKKCSSQNIQLKGTGIQKIEEELHKRYPQANILRADKDTTRSKQHFTYIYQSMKSGSGDILLGTQIIAKGLHLENVDLVGVINADMGLHIPDFRSSERVFQLLTQVAGRSGRKNEGKVIFQTFQVDHEVIQAASLHNYFLIYNNEIKNRKLLKYPPFSSVIKLIFVHKDKEKCIEESQRLKKYFHTINKQKTIKHIITSAPAYIPKIHKKYYWHILIRGPQPELFIDISQCKNWRIQRNPIFLS